MIRLATRNDIPRLLEIVEAYAYENPIKKLAEQNNHFPRYVEELLFSIISGRGLSTLTRISVVRLWLIERVTFGRPK